jgi:hypothetical protein
VAQGRKAGRVCHKSTCSAAGILGQHKRQGAPQEGGKKEGSEGGGAERHPKEESSRGLEGADLVRTPLPWGVLRKVSFSVL